MDASPKDSSQKKPHYLDITEGSMIVVPQGWEIRLWSDTPIEVDVRRTDPDGAEPDEKCHYIQGGNIRMNL